MSKYLSHSVARLPSIRIISIVIALVLVGCASGYQKFYSPSQRVTPETIASRRVSPAPETPIVERAQPGDPKQITDAYAKRGYIVVGSSMFNSGHSESEDAAVSQGRAVGADLVLILNPRYTGTVTSVIPITTPTSSTTYSSGTATAYGPGGTATAYGSGTATTYGSTTTYMPMTVSRSDYGAVYFVKLRMSFGAFFRDLNEAERQEMQTNKGVVIGVIVDGGPAFNADFLVGDVVTALNGVPISSGKDFSELLRDHAGRLVTISIVRRGQRIEKPVQLAI